jgi:carboxypeptidase Taq
MVVVDPLAALRVELAEIKHLARVASLLEWDQQVMMPPAGGPARADQMSALSRVIHERETSPELGRLLDEAEPTVAGLDPDSDDARLVKVARHDFEKAVKVPAELQAEIVRAAAEAYPVWVEARSANAFSRFLPFLERSLELKLRYVECMDGGGEPYDVLLDDYEQGMKSEEVRRIFARLKEALIPIARASVGSTAVDDAPLCRQLPEQGLREIERRVLDEFGFEPGAWRLDPTVHPFETAIAIDDIRLTTRYEVEGLESLYSSMHEFGHGLYERQIAADLDSSPLARGASLGWHESQSLLWENLVGRGRAFWERFGRELRASFPSELSSVSDERVFAMVNKVEPSLIRVEADEATYNLHVILRFELEQEMLAGRLDLADLPQAWNELYDAYLGIDVPEDRLGVLQDVHWALGSFGYFPTYTLGYLVAAQLWQRITAELPQLEDEIRRGEFSALREWLRENLHRHGRKFTPAELHKRILGGPVDPEPFISYLRAKLADVYGGDLLAG